MFKKLKQHFTLNNGVLLTALLITASWAWGTVTAIQKNFVLQQQVDSLAQQVAFQELENKTLDFQKKYYESREYLELSARERLNKAAPGEKLIMLPSNTVQASTETVVQPEKTPLAERSNFQQWLFFLFGSKS